MNSYKTISTTYRRLENILYLMGINPVRSFKAWDGSTVWEYEDTPEVRLIASTLKDLEAKLKEMRGGTVHD